MTDNEARSAIFRRKVREMRTDRSWSQGELGRRVGLGQSRVATIEDTGSVTIDQAQAFADAFGVPIEVLLYEKAPAAEDVHVRQVQRLLRMSNAVRNAWDEVNELIMEVKSELPGKQPRGSIVTATYVQRGDE